MLFGIVLVLSAVAAVSVCGVTGGFAGFTWLWLLPVGFVGAFLTQALLIFLFVWISTLFIDTHKPQEKDNKFYRFIIHTLADTAVPLFRVRMHTRGLEKTPQQGRFLLVCNHLNIMDPVILMGHFRKSQLAFISKRENGTMFLVGKLMHKILCQPINRENDREALKTIVRCIQILKEDQASIAVFPEGYTSLDEKLHPFRSGVFKIALKTGVPIVVCTVQNTQHILRNAAHLKATDVHLHLLDVISPEEMAGMTAVQVGNRVHEMMAQDLGPENVLQSADET